MSGSREAGAQPIEGYRLIEPLGSGGFGEAWKCEAPGGIFKAIKFVFGNLNSLDDGDAARAEQELKALEQVKLIRHPFVLQMDLIRIIDGELVIVMELADKSLHDVFVECQSAGLVGIPRDQLVCYVRDSAEALDYMCEKHGLQHLDIKPRNLFLVSDRVKVADFGLVKGLDRASVSGVLGGVTPLYASPETFTGKFSDRSDQYSLAIVYMELLTGQRPFNGKTARALAQQHVSEEPELRSLPEPERPVVARALAKDPAKRFPNCLAFVRALYNSRLPARLPAPQDENEGLRGNRPRTLHDTMEDIHLEQVAGRHADLLEEVDLGASPGDDPVSELGLTAAQPQTGALRPTVLVGIGSLGRRALMEVRCRLLDRFGDLEALPVLRFLSIDSDAQALKTSARGAPELAFRPGEVYHLPLQPIAHYRQRQMNQLQDWLPTQKLYAMPRNLQTQGSRALGRLAFSDNYLRLLSRVKREVQAAAHPDALYQAVSGTGLALRDNVPRVVVVGSACGGGSGYLPDLGYALRRLLKQLRQPEGTVTAYLLCGAPEDPATPPAELANLYATLTELNHFSEGMAPFSAQYGSDGARVREEGPPFDAIYLATQHQRSPEARRDLVAHLGSYLFHELTTPLGLQLDQVRLLTASAGPFRSFGTHSVWFPRGLLLRLAGRRAVQHLAQQWALTPEEQQRSGGRVNLEMDAALARLTADPDLRPEALTARIEALAARHLDNQTPSEGLVQFLGQIEEQCWQFGGPDDPATWSRQAIVRVKDWLGSGVQPQGAMTVGSRKSRVTRALEQALATLAETWDERLSGAVVQLMDSPGYRVATAENSYERLIGWVGEAIDAQSRRVREQSLKVAEAQNPLQEALRLCASGSGWSLFSRRSRPMRVFLDHLASLARQSLNEDIAVALLHFYQQLQGRLRDRLRDCTYVRHRLRHVIESLTLTLIPEDDDPTMGPETSLSPTPLSSTENFWEALRDSPTTRVVLPDGETELDRAAGRFIASLTAEHWAHLDQNLQEFVIQPRGGLNKACGVVSDIHRHLAGPLLEQAAQCLSQYLPVTDVAQVELALSQDGHEDLVAQVRLAYQRATPTVIREPKKQRRDSKVMALAGGFNEARPTFPELALPGENKQKQNHRGYLLIPASDAGKAYAEQALGVLEGIHLVRVPGQADLMYCREQAGLTPADLGRMLTACRTAYEELALSPNLSPHARFDTQDWVPLEP